MPPPAACLSASAVSSVACVSSICPSQQRVPARSNNSEREAAGRAEDERPPPLSHASGIPRSRPPKGNPSPGRVRRGEAKRLAHALTSAHSHTHTHSLLFSFFRLGSPADGHFSGWACLCSLAPPPFLRPELAGGGFVAGATLGIGLGFSSSFFYSFLFSALPAL